MAYDPGWILRVGKMVVKPEKTTLGMIRYSLSPVVSDDLILQYSPSRAVNFLSIVSIVSIVLVSVLIFITRKKL